MREIVLNKKFAKCNLDTNVFPFAVFNGRKGNKLVLTIKFKKQLMGIEHSFFVKNTELIPAGDEMALDVIGYKKTGWETAMSPKTDAEWCCVVGYTKPFISNKQVAEFFNHPDVKPIYAEIQDLIGAGYVTNRHLYSVLSPKDQRPNELEDLFKQLSLLEKAMAKYDWKGDEGKPMDAKAFMEKHCQVTFRDEYGFPIREETRDNVRYAHVANTIIELKVTNNYGLVDLDNGKFPITTHTIVGGDRHSVGFAMSEVGSEHGVALTNLFDCVDGVFKILEEQCETLNKASLENAMKRNKEAGKTRIGKEPKEEKPAVELLVNEDAPKNGKTEGEIHDADFEEVTEKGDAK